MLLMILYSDWIILHSTVPRSWSHAVL